MPGTFAGRVALITGSSNGIGRASAKLFAREGAKVTITGRNLTALEEARQEVLTAGATPSDVLAIPGDITDLKIQKKLVEETVKKFGKLDILVNNAGAASIDNAPAAGFDGSLEVFDYTIETEFRVLSITQIALPHLAASKGDIVNISSIAGLHFASPTYPYYAMAKAALDSMTRSMAVAFIEKGVRVNGINPGIITTKFINKMGATDEVADKMRHSMVSDHAKVPIGRAGHAEEIAEAIAFLCDRSKSSFMIGHK